MFKHIDFGRYSSFIHSRYSNDVLYRQYGLSWDTLIQFDLNYAGIFLIIKSNKQV